MASNLEHEARALAEMHARVCGERDAATARAEAAARELDRLRATSPDRIREIALQAAKITSDEIFNYLLETLATMRAEQRQALGVTKEEAYGRAGYLLALEDIEGRVRAALAVSPEAPRG